MVRYLGQREGRDGEGRLSDAQGELVAPSAGFKMALSGDYIDMWLFINVSWSAPYNIIRGILKFCGRIPKAGFVRQFH